MTTSNIPSPLAGEGDSPKASGERGFTPTDQRQGVTPTQHSVLDLLDQRAPQWRMMSTTELEALADRQFTNGPIAPSNTIRLAALALHLAERHHAKAFTGTGAVTDLAALGVSQVYFEGASASLDASDQATIGYIIGEELDALAADQITPVLALQTYTQGENLHAVLVPTAFDAEGHAEDHQLQFHPTHASALRARLIAVGEDYANG